MKVVILCGGRGTRLRDETEFRPKPMVPVGGKPILWHIMKLYGHHGHRDFVLCLGYRGSVIKEYFRNLLWHESDVVIEFGKAPKVSFPDGAHVEDWRVTLADTGESSMTAYRIRQVAKYLGNDTEFLVTYGDGVGDIDINAAIAQHRKSGAICTLTAVRPPGRFGELTVSGSEVKVFNEKPQTETGLINGGFMVCSRALLDYLPDDASVMLEQQPLKRLAKEGKLGAYTHEGFWQPMDTPQELQLLNELWASGHAPWKLWKDRSRNESHAPGDQGGDSEADPACAEEVHAAQRPADRKPETSGGAIPYAGRVFDADEVEAAVDASLDFWLTLGPHGDRLEADFAAHLGVRRSILVNSGSSANLLALASLTSHKIPKERRLKPGDEVITAAAGFPTTVAPIVQLGAVPVFIDSDPRTGNPRVDQLEGAFDPQRTRAVILAHTLGNPFDIAAVARFCREHKLWFIEDNCDALGSTYSMPGAEASGLGLYLPEGTSLPPGELTRNTGTWGDLSTQSFYPPHHMTLGEGGMVNIGAKAALASYVLSLRDWGRDCWCASGVDNTCGKRFDWSLGQLPKGYDHKYIYSHLGYNLKPLDVQAAIGRAQLKKLPGFGQARRDNWVALRKGLADLEDLFEFSLPTHATRWSEAGFSWDKSGRRTDPSWFGFMLCVKPTAPFGRSDLARHLDAQGIGNRMLFGGNLVRQPAFVQLAVDRPGAYRVSGELPGADELMNRALFLGTYPGLTGGMIERMIATVRAFVSR